MFLSSNWLSCLVSSRFRKWKHMWVIQMIWRKIHCIKRLGTTWLSMWDLQNFNPCMMIFCWSRMQIYLLPHPSLLPQKRGACLALMEPTIFYYKDLPYFAFSFFTSSMNNIIFSCCLQPVNVTETVNYCLYSTLGIRCFG